MIVGDGMTDGTARGRGAARRRGPARALVRQPEGPAHRRDPPARGDPRRHRRRDPLPLRRRPLAARARRAHARPAGRPRRRERAVGLDRPDGHRPAHDAGPAAPVPPRRRSTSTARRRRSPRWATRAPGTSGCRTAGARRPRAARPTRWMWRQLLEDPAVRARSGFVPTIVHLPSPQRRDMTTEQRLEELRRATSGWSTTPRGAAASSSRRSHGALEECAWFWASRAELQASWDEQNAMLREVWEDRARDLRRAGSARLSPLQHLPRVARGRAVRRRRDRRLRHRARAAAEPIAEVTVITVDDHAERAGDPALAARRPLPLHARARRAGPSRTASATTMRGRPPCSTRVVELYGDRRPRPARGPRLPRRGLRPRPGQARGPPDARADADRAPRPLLLGAVRAARRPRARVAGGTRACAPWSATCCATPTTCCGRAGTSSAPTSASTGATQLAPAAADPPSRSAPPPPRRRAARGDGPLAFAYVGAAGAAQGRARPRARLPCATPATTGG